LPLKLLQEPACGPEKSTQSGHVNLDKFFLHPIRGGNRKKLTNDREGSW
jgi:hypothetical protein